MYLLYIDDSGQSAPRKDKTIPYKDITGNSRFLTLGAYLVDCENVVLDEKILTEIKSTCLRNKYNELKFSNDKKKSPLKCHYRECDLNGKRINECHRGVIFSKLKDIQGQFFSVTIDKELYEDNCSDLEEKEFYKVTLTKLLQMVLNYLINTEATAPVVVFVDNKEKHNQLLIQVYEDIVGKATYSNFKDHGLFLATVNVCVSTFTPGIQIADLVAGAIWTSYEHENKDYSSLLKDKFPTYKNQHIDVSIAVIRDKQ